MDLFQIAQEHHRGGRYRQAEEIYRAILSSHPDDPDALHWLGVLILQANRPVEAVPLLERAAAARPADSAFSHNLAQGYLAARRIDDAVKAFDRTIAIDPQAKVLYSAALANLSLQTPQSARRALELFQKARDAGLDLPELHQHLGLALLMADRTDEALEELQTAVRELPESAEPHLHFAAAWARKGQRGPARVCLARALEINPTYAHAAYVLAVMEAEDNRLPEAEALLRATISMKPDSLPAYHALAHVLQQSEGGGSASVEASGCRRTVPGQIGAATAGHNFRIDCCT